MFALITTHAGLPGLLVALLVIFAALAYVTTRLVRMSAQATRIDDETLFSKVAWGYFCGVNALIIPILLLTIVGIVVEGRGNFQLLALLMLPLIVGGQALLLAAAVVLGNRIRRWIADVSRRSQS